MRSKAELVLWGWFARDPKGIKFFSRFDVLLDYRNIKRRITFTGIDEYAVFRGAVK